MKQKRVYIETYGCQMNEYDSGVVGNLLKNDSYQIVDSAENSDVILLNTCAVRENAHDKIYSRLKHLGAMKRKNPDLLIGILGCMAQNLGDNLISGDLPLDLIVGPDNYRDLHQTIAAAGNDNRKLDLTILSKTETYEDVHAGIVSGISASVTIMRGCNNFCTFCVVPYTRGRERSRSPQSIIDEVNSLVTTKGIRQITLLGQNVNSYSHNHSDFASLIEDILRDTDVPRIRFISPHPKDFPEKLLYLMAENERFSPSIHLPLQAGSNSVLNAMKRTYTREEYIGLVEKIRSIVPHAGLTTDIIVGFPNETEEEFQDTMSLIETVRFDSAFMYKYSEREGTKAKQLYVDNIPEEVKSSRLSALVEKQVAIAAEQNALKTGRVFPVQIEGFSKKSANDLSGKTNCGRVVVFPHNGSGWEPGDIVNVKIESTSSATLKGVAV